MCRRPVTAQPGISVSGAAKADGYGLFVDAAGIACIAQPGLGTMGIHYVNGGLVGDTVLDPAKPEALVYEPGIVRPAAARCRRVHRLQGGLGRRARVAAVALRDDVRPRYEPEPLRATGLLRTARVDLAGEPRRHVHGLEPAGQLQLVLSGGTTPRSGPLLRPRPISTAQFTVTQTAPSPTAIPERFLPMRIVVDS